LRVLVTGGAGFIGANVCRRLLDNRGISSVSVIDDLSTGDPRGLDGLDAEFVDGSILDPDTLARAIDGCDSVVHLAARPSVPKSLKDPIASHEANATGTVRVLEAARAAGGPQVIVASSSSVYGGNQTLPKSEDLTPMPLSPYAASKLATESYALAYQSSYSLPVLAFRFFNVFGPGQTAGHAYAAVIPAFVSAALQNRPLPVYGDGLQTRDFTFVGTVAAVIEDAVLRRVSDVTPVNLAFGTRTDLLTLIELLEDIVGEELEVEHLEPRAADIRDSQADSSKLRALFPAVGAVELEQGLRQTVEWFRSSFDPLGGTSAP
jgi:UDP-glucose 4-epimerase